MSRSQRHFVITSCPVADELIDQSGVPAIDGDLPSGDVDVQVMSDRDFFDEIAVGTDLAETVVVAFTQRPDSDVPEVDLTGTDDFDTAIAIAAKGFFTLMLDSMGFWDPDDDEDGEGDFDPA